MYEITVADIKATTEQEFNEGTVRCLPKVSEIPEEFYDEGNPYKEVAEMLYIGVYEPTATAVIVSDYAEFKEDPTPILKFLIAHLRSSVRNYEDKVAALAYMLFLLITII